MLPAFTRREVVAALDLIGIAQEVQDRYTEACLTRRKRLSLDQESKESEQERDSTYRAYCVVNDNQGLIS